MRVDVGDILTSCAILVALITWWATFLQARRTERVARTAEVIANLSVSESLAEATYQVTRLINSNTRVLYSSLDESAERHIVKILDYYEYMCDLYESGILSKATIASLRGNLMARTWDTCEDYVQETRRRQGRQVYAAFERFVAGLPSRDSGQTPSAGASSGVRLSADGPGSQQSGEGSPQLRRFRKLLRGRVDCRLLRIRRG